MTNEKVLCEECECWIPIGQSGKGDCKRHSPQTFEQVLSCWPQTKYDNFCWEGIKKKPQVIND